MKMIWSVLVLILLGAVASAMNLEELKLMMTGYIKGLKIELKDDFFPCLDLQVAEIWDASLVELEKVKKWTEPFELLYGFAAFLEPAIRSLGMFPPCDKKNVTEPIIIKIQALVAIKDELIKKILDKQNDLIPLITNFITEFKGKNFQNSGEKSGDIISNLLS